MGYNFWIMDFSALKRISVWRGQPVQEKKVYHNIKRNSLCSLISLMLTFISGFILPHLIIRFYGSEVNGLVSSINQFLQIFSFLEMGMASVVVSSLYKPIAKEDAGLFNRVVSSASKFYQYLGCLLLVYVFVLSVVYPSVIGKQFSNWYIITLILAMSVNMFAQYYFGVVDFCILESTQRAYVYHAAQSLSIILNIICSCILIFGGFSIQTVKILSAFFCILRPFFVRIYINKNYSVNRKEKYTKEPINQKWNGIAQHISFIVLQSSDTVILSLFSTLSNVSVYAVYNLVVAGLGQLMSALFSGVKPVLGNSYANGEYKRVQKMFERLEWFMHNTMVLIYGCTLNLILPFVLTYTYGVTDMNYEQPIFALLITLANFVYSLRLPYVMLIHAAGRYKETQNSFIFAAFCNIIISVILVNRYGLTGVAVGTVISMLYQTLYLLYYCGRHIWNNNINKSVKLVLQDVLLMLLIYYCTLRIHIGHYAYSGWLKQAALVFAVSLGIVVCINMMFYKEFSYGVLRKMCLKFRKDS